MIFDKQKSFTIITRRSAPLVAFLEKLQRSYGTLKRDNLIVNLLSQQNVTLNDLLLFMKLSNKHRKKKKSFVIITDKINFDDVPDELIVVPTMQEAKDIIAMEDIERDLGF